MWSSLHHLGFSHYEISDEGLINNVVTGRTLHPSLNQYGVMRIGLIHDDRQEQVTMTLASLVADCFVAGKEPGYQVINLDGDRTNNRAENLAWRPAWFAKMYHRQFHIRNEPRIAAPIVDVDSLVVYENSWAACMEHGLLDRDIMSSVVNGSHVFPTRQTFILLYQD